MMLPTDLAEVLRRLDRSLADFYGGRYRGLVLYGSYARGEADEGSDVDLLLLLEGEVRTSREISRTSSLLWPYSLESGYVLSLMPTGLEDYKTSWEPYLVNARAEGIPLSAA